MPASPSVAPRDGIGLAITACSAFPARGGRMRSKVLNENGERTFALIFETGEEALSGLTRFASEQNLTASRFTAIGAFSDVVLGYFDWEKKDYERIPVKEQVE